MKNVLIVLAHPNFSASNANKVLLENLFNEENITIHNIYENYPDKKIDIAKEQELLTKHSRIILQFPTFWFNVPSFLKQWIDEVFTYGWAYGPDGNALVSKEFGIVTTTGGTAESYYKNGERGFSVDEFLLPVIGSIKYVNAKYIGCVVLNNALNLKEEQTSEAKQHYQNLIS